MKLYHIIVDGSNVAFSKRNDRKKAILGNLEILIRYLAELKKKYPIEYEIITDATLKYRIDEPEKLEEYYKTGVISECPSHVKADEFIVDYMQIYPDRTLVISNDNFSEYNLEKAGCFSLCKFIIIFNKIIIPNFKHVFERKVERIAEVEISIKT
ncbi:MAG: hypothetical protein ACFFCS_09220 [Candidatus Hodarchaeota archaeon]